MSSDGEIMVLDGDKQEDQMEDVEEELNEEMKKKAKNREEHNKRVEANRIKKEKWKLEKRRRKHRFYFKIEKSLPTERLTEIKNLIPIALEELRQNRNPKENTPIVLTMFFRQKVVKRFPKLLTIPHPFHPENQKICVFYHNKPFAKKAQQTPEVAEVVQSKLLIKNKTEEQLLELARVYDFFVVEKETFGLVMSKLPNVFKKNKKKMPIPITIEDIPSDGLSSLPQKIIFRMPLPTLYLELLVGKYGQGYDKIAENVVAILEELCKNSADIMKNVNFLGIAYHKKTIAFDEMLPIYASKIKRKEEDSETVTSK